MTAINAAISGLDMARAILDRTGQAIAEGYVSAEVVTARDQAQTQLEVQANVLKEAIAAEAQIFDILI